MNKSLKNTLNNLVEAYAYNNKCIENGIEGYSQKDLDSNLAEIIDLFEAEREAGYNEGYRAGEMERI